ncbi:MAG: bifunctional diaminohydroxyphosphoribosylaminopyrimidine deaminase/5-amino-6-(5-phosphoribosylamino)uracil reductase RibD, partial [Rhodospirillales bacterium]
MRAALGLASRGLGRVAPNPAVGCVLVRPDLGQSTHDGLVVGRGWTQPGGRPHAETEAIRRAGTLAQGAHAYVTLEPCNHQGQTGPCTEALIAAGITSATVALEDPDPRVAGSGFKRLRDAGIAVRVGLLADQARRLNAGFLSVVERKRPWVTMKTATTLDGAIASRTGHSQWITGPAARARGHLLRAENDAIISGIGTVRA